MRTQEIKSFLQHHGIYGKEKPYQSQLIDAHDDFAELLSLSTVETLKDELAAALHVTKAWEGIRAFSIAAQRCRYRREELGLSSDDLLFDVLRIQVRFFISALEVAVKDFNDSRKRDEYYLE